MVSIEVFDGEEWVPITSENNCYVSTGATAPTDDLESLIYFNNSSQEVKEFSASLYFRFDWTPQKKPTGKCQVVTGKGLPTPITDGAIYINNEEKADKIYFEALFFKF